MFTRMNYLWELCTGLYMMDTSEKLIFNGVVVGTLSLVVYYVARIFTGTPAAAIAS